MVTTRHDWRCSQLTDALDLLDPSPDGLEAEEHRCDDAGNPVGPRLHRGEGGQTNPTVHEALAQPEDPGSGLVADHGQSRCYEGDDGGEHDTHGAHQDLHETLEKVQTTAMLQVHVPAGGVLCLYAVRIKGNIPVT